MKLPYPPAVLLLSVSVAEISDSLQRSQMLLAVSQKMEAPPPSTRLFLKVLLEIFRTSVRKSQAVGLCVSVAAGSLTYTVPEGSNSSTEKTNLFFALFLSKTQF